MMGEILKDLFDHKVVIYIDDILICSESELQHEQLVSEVLHRLQEHGIAGAIDTSKFHKTFVEFLRYIIEIFPTGFSLYYTTSG
jgi:hypothetical protein